MTNKDKKYSVIKKLINSNEYDEALKELENIPEDDRDNEWRYYRIEVLVAKDEYDEALKELENIHEDDRDDKWHYYRIRALIHALINKGEYDEALKELENIHEDDRDSKRHYRIHVLIAKDEYDEALKELENIHEDDRDNEWHYYRIHALINKGEYDEALKELENIHKDDRDNEWHYYRIEILVAKGNYKEVFEELDKMQEKKNKKYNYLIEKSEYYRKKGLLGLSLSILLLIPKEYRTIDFYNKQLTILCMALHPADFNNKIVDNLLFNKEIYGNENDISKIIEFLNLKIMYLLVMLQYKQRKNKILKSKKEIITEIKQEMKHLRELIEKPEFANKNKWMKIINYFDILFKLFSLNIFQWIKMEKRKVKRELELIIEEGNIEEIYQHLYANDFPFLKIIDPVFIYVKLSYLLGGPKNKIYKKIINYIDNKKIDEYEKKFVKTILNKIDNKKENENNQDYIDLRYYLMNNEKTENLEKYLKIYNVTDDNIFNGKKIYWKLLGISTIKGIMIRMVATKKYFYWLLNEMIVKKTYYKFIELNKRGASNQHLLKYLKENEKEMINEIGKDFFYSLKMDLFAKEKDENKSFYYWRLIKNNNFKYAFSKLLLLLSMGKWGEAKEEFDAFYKIYGKDYWNINYNRIAGYVNFINGYFLESVYRLKENINKINDDLDRKYYSLYNVSVGNTKYINSANKEFQNNIKIISKVLKKMQESKTSTKEIMNDISNISIVKKEEKKFKRIFYWVSIIKKLYNNIQGNEQESLHEINIELYEYWKDSNEDLFYEVLSKIFNWLSPLALQNVDYEEKLNLLMNEVENSSYNEARKFYLNMILCIIKIYRALHNDKNEAEEHLKNFKEYINEFLEKRKIEIFFIDDINEFLDAYILVGEYYDNRTRKPNIIEHLQLLYDRIGYKKLKNHVGYWLAHIFYNKQDYYNSKYFAEKVYKGINDPNLKDRVIEMLRLIYNYKINASFLDRWFRYISPDDKFKWIKPVIMFVSIVLIIGSLFGLVVLVFNVCGIILPNNCYFCFINTGEYIKLFNSIFISFLLILLLPSMSKIKIFNWDIDVKQETEIYNIPDILNNLGVLLEYVVIKMIIYELIVSIIEEDYEIE